MKNFSISKRIDEGDKGTNEKVFDSSLNRRLITATTVVGLLLVIVYATQSSLQVLAVYVFVCCLFFNILRLVASV